MQTTRKIICFATVALASASMPAFSGTPGEVDFAWYANVGKPVDRVMEVHPAPRPGYIWAPGRYESTGTAQQWKPGAWIRDDYQDQVAAHADGSITTYATGPLELRDRDGNLIPTTPDAYPIDSARR